MRIEIPEKGATQREICNRPGHPEEDFIRIRKEKGHERYEAPFMLELAGAIRQVQEDASKESKDMTAAYIERYRRLLFPSLSHDQRVDFFYDCGRDGRKSKINIEIRAYAKASTSDNAITSALGLWQNLQAAFGALEKMYFFTPSAKKSSFFSVYL